MFLAALKPSMAKLGATTLIVITTLLYGVLNTAFTQETAKQMNEAFLGEPFVMQIKQINQTFACERDQKLAELVVLAQKNSEAMLSVRNKRFAMSFLLLLTCAYLSACIILRKKAGPHAA